MSHIKLFIDHLKIERELSNETTYNYEKDIEQFTAFVCKPVEQVTTDDIVRFLAHLKDKSMKASTRNRKLSALKTFFKYLARRGRVPFSPAADIEGAKQDKHLPKPINVEVLDQLFEAVNNLRDRTLLEILYGCGLRRMELVKIRISDIDFTQGFIRVLGKGGTERIVPIRGIALQITKELAAKASGEWLFEGGNGHLSARQANDIIAKWRGVVGAKWITPHKFRHSFATHLLNNGMELKYVQELLGHANPATTQIYTKVDNRRVANDYEQFHPRAKSAL